MTDWQLPEQGVTFWPVGNGDAVTVSVDADTFIQIDINHRAVADDDDDERVPVVDRLVECLPQEAGADKPHLGVLAISHHDEDHCSGFARLNDEVRIDELWITLRSFVEVDDGLTEAGQAVYDEACRRRAAEIAAAKSGGRAAAGDRLRVIGNSDLLSDGEWSAFPEELLTSAGELIPEINGEDRKGDIEIFVHTPFQSDTEDGTRNSSSLGIHITMKDQGEITKRLLLLGDLEHEQIEAFVAKTERAGNDERLCWDVLLAPHHCSRNAVRKKVDGEWTDADAAEDLRRYASDESVVVVSSRSFDEISEDDTDPPHTDARELYEDIVGADDVHFTHGYATGSDTDPLTVTWTGDAGPEVGESSAARAARWASIGTVSSTVGIDPGEEYVRGGDRPYA